LKRASCDSFISVIPTERWPEPLQKREIKINLGGFIPKCSQMEQKILLRIIITGRVQGVGYRWNTAREATGLGITGYVKNMPDGTVYIEAEGYPDQLDFFISRCKEGPGTVEEVIAESFPPEGYSKFSIGY